MAAATALTGVEALPIVQTGTNKKASADLVADLARPMKFVSADFTDETKLDDPRLVGKQLAIFHNGINRFLEDAEWDGTATGINILLEGFDSTLTNYTFYITVLAA